MDNQDIIELANDMMNEETDEIMAQELWRIQLFTESHNGPVSYCDGGDDDGKRYPEIANSNDETRDCSNCRLSNLYGKYGCVRNTLALGHN